jgi:hypothetical protein
MRQLCVFLIPVVLVAAAVKFDGFAVEVAAPGVKESSLLEAAQAGVLFTELPGTAKESFLFKAAQSRLVSR